MISADEIATLVRLPTTSHDEAVVLIEKYGKVQASCAMVEAAVKTHALIASAINAPLAPVTKEPTNA